MRTKCARRGSVWRTVRVRLGPEGGGGGRAGTRGPGLVARPLSPRSGGKRPGRGAGKGGSFLAQPGGALPAQGCISQPNCHRAAQARNEYSQSANRRKFFIETEPEGVKGKQALFTRRQRIRSAQPAGAGAQRHPGRRSSQRAQLPARLVSVPELEALLLLSPRPSVTRRPPAPSSQARGRPPLQENTPRGAAGHSLAPYWASLSSAGARELPVWAPNALSLCPCDRVTSSERLPLSVLPSLSDPGLVASTPGRSGTEGAGGYC